MNLESILKKVKKIEIKSRKRSNDIFSGAYHTAFKGRGMSFSEVREYSPGDDIRAIDWNVTARLRSPYIKVFQEERELMVMLLIDVSHSSYYGGLNQSKLEFIAEIAATIGFATMQNNDKIGVLFFSDKTEKYIPPQKGKSHILRIIREIITIKPSIHNTTNINDSLYHFNLATRKRSIAFLISDFVSEEIEQHLRISARKHDLIGIHVYDSSEHQLPHVGVIKMKDAESGKMHWVNTNDQSTNKILLTEFKRNQDRIKDIFTKHGAGYISIPIGSDFTLKLRNYFESRIIKH